jgi:hypothetical protein
MENLSEFNNSVKDVFNDSSELSKIGTVEQYQNYLKTIFPNSKVSDIVYHGTKENFKVFKDVSELDSSNTNSKSAELGNFFTTNKELAELYKYYSGKNHKNIITERIIEKVKEIADLVDAFSDNNAFKDAIIEDIRANTNESTSMGVLYDRLQDIVSAESNERIEIILNSSVGGGKIIDALIELSFREKYRPFLKDVLSTEEETIKYLINNWTNLKQLNEKNVPEVKDLSLEEYVDKYTGGDTFNPFRYNPAVKVAIINLEKPTVNDDINYNPETDERLFTDRIIENDTKDSDGYIFKNVYDPIKSDIYITKKASQIHELGSEKDIKGFKEFVKNTSKDTSRDSTSELKIKYKDGISNVNDILLKEVIGIKNPTESELRDIDALLVATAHTNKFDNILNLVKSKKIREVLNNIKLIEGRTKAFKVYNKASEANLSEATIKEYYGNYVSMITRQRVGKQLTYTEYKNAFDKLSLLQVGNTQILGEWDAINGIFKGRIMGSTNIVSLVKDLNIIKNEISFMASVPNDMGKMFSRLGFYKVEQGKDFNFKGESMVKNLYFSDKEAARKVFKKDPNEVTKKEVETYDMFYNEYKVLSDLMEGLNSRNIQDVYKAMTELGKYDKNAYYFSKKLMNIDFTEKELKEGIAKYVDVVKNRNSKQYLDAINVRKTQEDTKRQAEIDLFVYNFLDTIKKDAATNRINIEKTDTLNDPIIYDKLETKLNKTLTRFLSKLGITTKIVDEIKDKHNTDGIGFIDMLNRTVNIANSNVESYPEYAAEMIVTMMRYNPMIVEIKNYMKNKGMFKAVRDKSLIGSLGDVQVGDAKYKEEEEYYDRLYEQEIANLIAKELHKKTGTELPQTLIDKLKRLVEQFLNFFNPTRMGRINKTIGQITDEILIENQALVKASVYKPGAHGKQTSPVTVESALKSDEFGSSIVFDLSEQGFMLTGSTALSEQGLILRPTENPLHDIDWVSPFDEEETVDKFLSVYPNAVHIRDIKNDDYTTLTWMIAPKGYTVSNLVTEGKNNVVISYDVINDETGEVEGTYENDTKLKKETITGIEAKPIDFFVSEETEEKEYSEYKTANGKIIKLANWKSIFEAKLAFSRYKDIWDYNRFIGKEAELKDKDIYDVTLAAVLNNIIEQGKYKDKYSDSTLAHVVASVMAKVSKTNSMEFNILNLVEEVKDIIYDVTKVYDSRDEISNHIQRVEVYKSILVKQSEEPTPDGKVFISDETIEENRETLDNYLEEESLSYVAKLNGLLNTDHTNIFNEPNVTIPILIKPNAIASNAVDLIKEFITKNGGKIESTNNIELLPDTIASYYSKFKNESWFGDLVDSYVNQDAIVINVPINENELTTLYDLLSMSNNFDKNVKHVKTLMTGTAWQEMMLFPQVLDNGVGLPAETRDIDKQNDILNNNNLTTFDNFIYNIGSIRYQDSKKSYLADEVLNELAEQFDIFHSRDSIMNNMTYGKVYSSLKPTDTVILKSFDKEDVKNIISKLNEYGTVEVYERDDARGVMRIKLKTSDNKINYIDVRTTDNVFKDFNRNEAYSILNNISNENNTEYERLSMEYGENMAGYGRMLRVMKLTQATNPKFIELVEQAEKDYYNNNITPNLKVLGAYGGFETITSENIEKTKRWVKGVLGDVNLEIVEGLIKSVDGSLNYGMSKSSGLILSDIAPIGTSYHEAFHFVMDYLVNENRANKVLADVMNEYGITDIDTAHEVLADLFRSYTLTRTGNANITGEMFDIIEQMDTLVRSINSPSLLELFDDISKGVFSSTAITEKESKERYDTVDKTTTLKYGLNFKQRESATKSLVGLFISTLQERTVDGRKYLNLKNKDRIIAFNEEGIPATDPNFKVLADTEIYYDNDIVNKMIDVFSDYLDTVEEKRDNYVAGSKEFNKYNTYIMNADIITQHLEAFQAGEPSIMDDAIQLINKQFNFKFKSLNELFEAQIEMVEETGMSPEDVSTSALFDTDAIQESFDSTFRPLTKQAIASLTKVKQVIDSNGNIKSEQVFNEFTGLPEFVEYDETVLNVISTLIGVTSEKQLLERLKEKTQVIPEFIELLNKVNSDENLLKSLFADVNKRRMKEKFIDNRRGLTVKTATKVAEYYYSDIWRENFKNRIVTDWKGLLQDYEGYSKDFMYLRNIETFTSENTTNDKFNIIEAVRDTITMFNKFGIEFTESELYNYIYDPNNATKNIIRGKAIKDYRTFNNSQKAAATLIELNRSLFISLQELIKAKKKAGDVNVVADNFNQLKTLNNFATIKITYGYTHAANKFMYPDLNGNSKNSIAKMSFMGSFMNALHNPDRTEALNLLLRYTDDASMKYSTLLHTIYNSKGEVIKQGLLNKVINENGIESYELNEEFISRFDYFVAGGTRNVETGKTNAYKKGETLDWQISKIKYFTEIDESFDEGDNITPVSMFGLIPGDASNNYLYTFDKLNVKRGKDFIVKDGVINLKEGSNLHATLSNLYKQEQARMNAAFNALFVQHPDNPEYYDYYRNEDGSIDMDYYTTSGFQKDFHYYSDKGNPVFMLPENNEATAYLIPTGNVFKYQNFEMLNKYRNNFNSKLEKDGKELTDFEIAEIMFEELVTDTSLTYKTYGDIITELKEKGDINKSINEYDLTFEMVTNQKIFNIEFQNMFSGITAEFVSERRGSKVNVSTKGKRQTAVRAKSMYQGGLVGSYAKHPSTTIAVLKDRYKKSLTYDAQIKALGRQLVADGYPEGSNEYLKRLDKFEQMLAGINTADGAGFASQQFWIRVQKENGRWDTFEHLFIEDGTYPNGEIKYKLREDISRNEILATIEPMKPVYSDRDLHSIQTRNGLYEYMKNDYLKYASFPLFEAFTKYHPELDAIRKHMEDTSLDQIIFESAMKQGITDMTSLDTGGKFDASKLNDLQVFNLKSNKFRIQLELSDHSLDSENKLGTQITKLIISNIKDNIDYMFKGNMLKGNEVIAKHFELLDNLIKEDFNNLLNKLDITVDDNGRLEVEDFSKIVELFKTELQRTGMTEDLEELLTLTPEGKLKHSLDANVIRGKLLSIFTAQFTNNVKFTKFNGAHLTLMPDAYIIPTPMRNYDSEKENFKYLQEGLKTNEEVDEYGRTRFIADVLVPVYDSNFINEDGTIDMENIDPDLLEIMGYRIPNSGKHSNVVFKVVGFIPKAMGSLIITSFDFVAKTGWDFDIDSVYMMNKHSMLNKDYRPGVEGSYKYISYESPKTYEDYVLEKIYDFKHLYKEDNIALKEINNSIRNIKQGGQYELYKYEKTLIDNEAAVSDDDLKDEYKLLYQDTKLMREALKALYNNKQKVLKSIYKQIKEDGYIVGINDWDSSVNTYKGNQNDLFDLWKEIQLHPDHMIEQYTESGFDDNKDARDKTDKSLDAQYSVAQKVVRNNPTSNTFSDITHPKAVMDKQNLSIFANYNVVGAIHQNVQSYIEPIEITIETGDYGLTKSHLKDIADTFKDTVVFTDTNNKITSIHVSLNRLGGTEETNFKNLVGKLITQDLSEDVDNAADAIKDYLINGITEYTRNTYSFMKLMGIPVEYIAYMINQPIIRETSDSIIKANSFINDVNDPYVKTRIIKDILSDIYYDNPENFMKSLENFFIDKDVLRNVIKEITKLAKNSAKNKGRIFEYASGSLLNDLVNVVGSQDITLSSMKNILENKPASLSEMSIDDKREQVAVYRKFNNSQNKADLVNKYNSLLTLDKKAIGTNFDNSRNTINKIKDMINDYFISIIEDKPIPTISSNKTHANILVSIYPSIANTVLEDIRNKAIMTADTDKATVDYTDAIVSKLSLDTNLEFNKDGLITSKSIYPLLETKIIYGDLAAQQIAGEMMVSEKDAVKKGLNDRLAEQFSHIKDNYKERLQQDITNYFISYISTSEISKLTDERIKDESLSNFSSNTYKKITEYRKNYPNRTDLDFTDFIDIISVRELNDNFIKTLIFKKEVTLTQLDDIKKDINRILENQFDLQTEQDKAKLDILFDLMAVLYTKTGFGYDKGGLTNIVTVPMQEMYDIFDSIETFKELLGTTPEVVEPILNNIYDGFLYSKIDNDELTPRIYPKALRAAATVDYPDGETAEPNIGKNTITIKGDSYVKNPSFKGNYFKRITSFPTKEKPNNEYKYDVFKVDDIRLDDKGDIKEVLYKRIDVDSRANSKHQVFQRFLSVNKMEEVLLNASSPLSIKALDIVSVDFNKNNNCIK